MSPDGQLIATGNHGENVINLWEVDIQTGEILKNWTIPKTHIKFNCSLFFDPSGQRLVLAGGSVEDEESVLMWNVQTGNRLFFPEGKTVAAFSPDGQTFVTGRYDENSRGAGAEFMTIWRPKP